MANNRKGRSPRPSNITALDLSGGTVNAEPVQTRSRNLPPWVGAIVIGLLLGFGVMAANGWLPRTDPLSGKKTGWFGRELPKNAASSWNPFAAPLPLPTPQLVKEYLYAGSKLLAVEDKDANAAPPSDLALWRPSTGIWYVLTSAEGVRQTQITFQWGLSTDVPAVGDYDGDGKTDFTIYRHSNATWYIVHSSDTSYHYPQFGTACTPPTGCDIPAPADYDGDGRTDVAVFRPSDGKFYISQSSTSTMVQYTIGQSGDKVAPADYDGDGRADMGVWRSGSPCRFHYRRSSDGQTSTVDLGSAGTDQPVSADYDGDGKADFALLAGNVWTIRSSATGSTTTTTWQNAGDLPVQSDYDGDGKVDLAVWRDSNGHWYIKKSATGATREEVWGVSGDIPVPAYYKH